MHFNFITNRNLIAIYTTRYNDPKKYQKNFELILAEQSRCDVLGVDSDTPCQAIQHNPNTLNEIYVLEGY